MALLQPTKQIQKEQLRIYANKILLEEINQYCQWLGVRKIDDFFEQAAEYILQRDKDWRLYQETLPKESGTASQNS